MPICIEDSLKALSIQCILKLTPGKAKDSQFKKKNLEILLSSYNVWVSAKCHSCIKSRENVSIHFSKYYHTNPFEL